MSESSGEPEDPHHSLMLALNRQRQDKIVKWVDVARALKITPQHLSRIRKRESPISEDVAYAMDKFLEREPGTTWLTVQSMPAVSNSTRSISPEWSAAQRAKWRTMTPAEIVAEGKRVETKFGVEGRLAYLEAAHHERAKRTAADSASSKDSAS
ncbi:hypothetical protein ACIBCH_20905 [Amycolatopsis thailandensis]|uniref:hypothetical protein n=1 Tax=Amycolatopsis thailandensis TaxID=589330 RepID=UPI0037BD62D2